MIEDFQQSQKPARGGSRGAASQGNAKQTSIFGQKQPLTDPEQKVIR
jgi:hypothetical protein